MLPNILILNAHKCIYSKLYSLVNMQKENVYFHSLTFICLITATEHLIKAAEYKYNIIDLWNMKKIVSG